MISTRSDYSLDTNSLFRQYEGMDIRKAHELFATDEQCLQYIEKMRWPDGIVRCPTCGDKNVREIRPPNSKSPRSAVPRSAILRRKISASGSTSAAMLIAASSSLPHLARCFHNTHLPLIVWFHAVTLMLNAKKV